MDTNALPAAHAAIAVRAQLLTPETAIRPSPCSEWTALDVLEHCIGGTAFTVALLAGGSAQTAIDAAMAGAMAGDDPAATWDRAATAEREAFEQVDPDLIVHHLVGDIPASQVLGLRTGDCTIHAWDLARAIGADEVLDPIAVDGAWAAFSPLAALFAASGMFGTGASGTMAGDAPLQSRLLDLAGRRP